MRIPKEMMYINCIYNFANRMYAPQYEMEKSSGHYINPRLHADEINKELKTLDNMHKTKIAEENRCFLIYKDKNGNKNYVSQENPEFTFYVSKDYKRLHIDPTGDKNKPFEYRYISLDDVIPVKATTKNLYKKMVEVSTNPDTKKLFDLCKKGVAKFQSLHLQPEFHGSDVNITDYFIDEFCEKNDQNIYNYGIDIASFDIEVAGADYEGFPDEMVAECPVNVITYYFDKTNELTVFILKYETETFKEFLKRVDEKKQEVKNKYKEYFGDFKINIKAFKNEFNLIKAFFKLVNNDKPDYITSWNMHFDMLTLKGRIIRNQIKYNPYWAELEEEPSYWHSTKRQFFDGYDRCVGEIMCPEDFPVKRAIIRIDESEEAKKDFTARTDKFLVYGYSVWLDMLPLYGNITRPDGKKESYTLNSIGMEETGMAKEDLSEDDTTIKTAYLDNYSKFFVYSCIDTLLLHLIVTNTDYLNLLHTIVYLTHTRADKALTKTVCLRNFVNVFYRQNGYVISNNRCQLHYDGRTGIKGAYVASPDLIEPLGSINGMPSNRVFDLVIDEDLSAMYPNIIISHNISSTTADMRIIIYQRDLTQPDNSIIQPNGSSESADIIKIPSRDITRRFMERYLSEDVVTYCNEYHNLPNYEEMYNIFKKIA